MVTSACSLVSAPSFVSTTRSAVGCSRHAEARWRHNSSAGGDGQPLQCSVRYVIGDCRRLWLGRSCGSRTAARGNASSAVAVMAGGKAKKRAVVVPEPDYRIPIVLLGFAGLLVYQDNLLTAAPVGLLGLLLLFQEVKVGDQLQESGENVFVGGKNRWKYSTFINWELWWPNFPILVYFKESQTKPEGQVHFFPVIFNGKQLYDVMVERAGPSKTSGPKQP